MMPVSPSRLGTFAQRAGRLGWRVFAGLADVGGGHTAYVYPPGADATERNWIYAVAAPDRESCLSSAWAWLAHHLEEGPAGREVPS